MSTKRHGRANVVLRGGRRRRARAKHERRAKRDPHGAMARRARARGQQAARTKANAERRALVLRRKGRA